MSEPTKVEPARFFEFVSKPGHVVLFVSFHPRQPFNPALPRYFRAADGGAVPFGRIGIVQLLLGSMPAVMFLRDSLQACGVSKVIDVLPGYYLFKDGQLVAWDAGYYTTADLDRLVGASLLGAIGYVFTRDFGVIRTSMRMGAREAAAARLATRFREAASQHRPSQHRSSQHHASYQHASYQYTSYQRTSYQRTPPPPPRNPMAELMVAYQLLGVDPSASDREVNAAWRRRQTELHPDLAANDPDEFARRSRLATELNRARDLIRAHRASRSHGASASA